MQGQAGKGANHTLFGGAFKACVAGGQTERGCLFRTPIMLGPIAGSSGGIPHIKIFDSIRMLTAQKM